MKKYMMVAWVVCVALAFGLSGCTADDVSDEGQKGNGNGSENAENCLSFVVSEKANTRMGGVEDVNRIKFVWTENDYKYLYCDVDPNGSAAKWEQPSMQYTLKADEHHPTLLSSVSFVFPQLQQISHNWSYFQPSPGQQNYFEPSYPSSPTVYGYNNSWYPLLFTAASNSTRAYVKNRQFQTGNAGFADKLAENGACFVGIAYADCNNSNSYTRVNPYGGSYTDTYKQYTLYVGNNVRPFYLPNSQGRRTMDGGSTWYYVSGTQPYAHGKYLVAGHKTSYISFMVYNPKGAMENVYVKQVKITTDQAINGNYPFSVDGIDLTHRGTSGLYKSTRLEITDGLSIAGSREKAVEKAAVMVALPGEYTGVKVEIKLEDPTSGVTLDIARNYPKMKLEEGKNLPLYFKLEYPTFTPQFETYHMWGALDWYWPLGAAPRNWVINSGVGSIAAPAAPNDTWPKAAGDTRWYDADNVEVQSGTLDYTAGVPTPNDVSYVLDKCYWDNTTTYVYDGHFFKGLVWVPNITKGHANAKDGSDWTGDVPATTLSSKSYVGTGSHDVAGYFPLPALGYWENGALKNVGKEGRYWLWNVDPENTTDNAYSVQFTSSGIKVVHDSPKKHGYLSMPVHK